MITVRNAFRSDIEALVKLCAEALPEKWSVESFSAEFDKSSVILCALDGDRIIGFSVTAVSFEEGYLELIAVNKCYRRQGIARRFIVKTEQLLKERGVIRILLDVRCSNDAALLYKACGYTVVCTRRNFYSNPREDAFTMQKELE